MKRKKSSIKAVTSYYYGGKAVYADGKGFGLNTILTGEEVRKLLHRGKVVFGGGKKFKFGKFKVSINVEAA